MGGFTKVMSRIYQQLFRQHPISMVKVCTVGSHVHRGRSVGVPKWDLGALGSHCPGKKLIPLASKSSTSKSCKPPAMEMSP